MDPQNIETIFQRLHNIVQRNNRRDNYTNIRDSFVREFFDEEELTRYREEFESAEFLEHYERALETYDQETTSGSFGDIGQDTGFAFYAIVRKLEPERIVETGVCNGLSSLCILQAVEHNGSGTLYSIDLPYHDDDDIDKFRDETFDGYGGAAVPANKNPGWIVPDDLRKNWSLRLGKSQRELPKLVTELETIDLFVHDSEHSLPCMLFEYELTWASMSEGGLLLSDDINWNNAFEEFVKTRQPKAGELIDGVGYMIKQ